MISKSIGTIAALSVVALVSADDTRVNSSTDPVTTQVGLSASGTTMPNIQAVASTDVVTNTSSNEGNSHQNHLGFGFGHGSGQTIGNRNVETDLGDLVFGNPDLSADDPRIKCVGGFYISALNGAYITHDPFAIGPGGSDNPSCGDGGNPSPDEH